MFHFTADDAGDQVARNDKEHVNTDISAGHEWSGKVVQDCGEHGNSAQTVNVGPIIG